MLSGNGETVDAIKSSLGKTIKTVENKDNVDVGRYDTADALVITFEDGSTLSLWDGGQSCCEHRYMVVEADLPYFSGAKLVDIDIRQMPDVEGDYDVHEAQVLVVTTDKGVIDAVTHNEHNGYYGGFWMQASVAPAVS